MTEDLQISYFEGSVVPCAVATVLSTIAGSRKSVFGRHWEKQRLSRRAVTSRSLLVLGCLRGNSQVQVLPKLRCLGFRGAVMVVSEEALDDLKETHKILLWSPGAREVFGRPWLLAHLLESASQIAPLGEETLRHLQQVLSQRSSRWRKRFDLALKRLADGDKSLPDRLQGLEKAFSELSDAAPYATHDEEVPLRRLIDGIRKAGRLDIDHTATAKEIVRRLLGRLEETGEIL